MSRATTDEPTCSTTTRSSGMANPFQVTFDAAGPRALGAFWCEVLGYIEQPPPPGFDTWEDGQEPRPPRRERRQGRDARQVGRARRPGGDLRRRVRRTGGPLDHDARPRGQRVLHPVATGATIGWSGRRGRVRELLEIHPLVVVVLERRPGDRTEGERQPERHDPVREGREQRIGGR